MTKHSRAERERRAAETIRVKEIEAAWLGSLAPDTAKAFTTAVAAARARGPVEPPPPMAPGTAAATATPGTRAEAVEGRANQELPRLPRLIASHDGAACVDGPRAPDRARSVGPHARGGRAGCR